MSVCTEHINSRVQSPKSRVQSPVQILASAAGITRQTREKSRVSVFAFNCLLSLKTRRKSFRQNMWKGPNLIILSCTRREAESFTSSLCPGIFKRTLTTMVSFRNGGVYSSSLRNSADSLLFFVTVSAHASEVSIPVNPVHIICLLHFLIDCLAIWVPKNSFQRRFLGEFGNGKKFGKMDLSCLSPSASYQKCRAALDLPARKSTWLAEVPSVSLIFFRAG